jgi:membrane protease YdiL (CAAX protease family)
VEASRFASAPGNSLTKLVVNQVKIVSEFNNPFPPPSLQPAQIVVADVPDQESPASPVPDLTNPHAEDPPWTGLDLFLMALVLMASLFLFTTISLGIGALFSHRPFRELAKDPGTLTMIAAMAISYLFVMTFMYLRLARTGQTHFWQAVSWQWPKGNMWPGYLIAGGVTAVTLGLLSRLLPMPKSLPLDRFFVDRRSAYLMVFFGVVIAPLAEELLFRGFLYPVLDRWLETLFMYPQRLRRGSFWICVIAGWGYLVHRMPHSSAGLLTGLAAIPILGIFLARSTHPSGRPAHVVLLPGISLLAWGLVSQSLAGRNSAYATATCLVLAFLLVAIAAVRPLASSPAAKVGRTLAILITSAAFAMMHSDQLGSAWAPLLVLFAVGCILTITRAVTRSVAAGVLIHVGYNATLFGLLYVATDHFRHLERMTQ